VGVRFTCDARRVIEELDRLAQGPSPHKFEAIMAASATAVAGKVHVLTGYLKGSGHMDSSWDGGEWTGTIGYARYPGIFELARGNAPTMNHPEGAHHFFEPAYGTEGDYKAAILSWLDDGDS
jgi:hypothetical protein